ncbi:MAG: hypothetical protein KKH34_05375, partial [Candidatus Omnitrophica bacterium]|nr:hypothetical protein [Candidatus Omnitrophota bacterium]MCG2705072.1 hypothetical protein [Candidatus Omnitrophota bacterium]
QNKDDAERLDWFKRTRSWHKVDEKVIEAVIKKFNGNPLLELFVLFSGENDLIKKYIKLNNSDFSDDLICSRIAVILYYIGSSSLKEFIGLMGNLENNQKKCETHYKRIMDSLELAIILDKNQVGAYMNLAIVKGMLGKYEDGLSYAKQGLAIVSQILDDDVPFYLSDIREIKTGKKDLEQIKERLSSLIGEYEMKID